MCVCAVVVFAQDLKQEPSESLLVSLPLQLKHFCLRRKSCQYKAATAAGELETVFK